MTFILDTDSAISRQQCILPNFDRYIGENAARIADICAGTDRYGVVMTFQYCSGTDKDLVFQKDSRTWRMISACIEQGSITDNNIVADTDFLGGMEINKSSEKNISSAFGKQPWINRLTQYKTHGTRIPFQEFADELFSFHNDYRTWPMTAAGVPATTVLSGIWPITNE